MAVRHMRLEELLEAVEGVKHILNYAMMREESEVNHGRKI